MFLPLILQIPVWVFNSIAIRNIVMMRETRERFSTVPVEERFLGMATEGTLWFQNLTTPDPTYVLPMVFGATFAFNIFMMSGRRVSTMPAASDSSRGQKMETYQNWLTKFLYCIAFIMIPLSSMQPSALTLYWATSSFMGVIINLILMSPKFRSLVRIPKTPNLSSTPYSDLRNRIAALLRQ
eukprot:TRINITY_DN8706_c0_g1_i4.p1 TRINITY_DN8706_c0_g1~~TRINITY_DN8706_c0_g1_i4.p1  ORF type:complete len:182 (+),score=25.58 TRINITY_DN8706_c0_g1_i4:178-723(+)